MKTSKLKLHPIKPGEVVQFPLKKPAS